MFKIQIIFSKTKVMRFISHLDLMRLITRALRRANLPVKMSEGFNPHPKLSFKRALKLGLESENEEVVITFRIFVNPVLIKEQLQRQLPEGISIKEAIIL